MTNTTGRLSNLTETLTSNLNNPVSSSEFDLYTTLDRVLSDIELSAAESGGKITFYGKDPIVPSCLRFGSMAAIALAAKAVAVAGIWKFRSGEGQDIHVDVRKALRRFAAFFELKWELINGRPPSFASDPLNPFLQYPPMTLWNKTRVAKEGVKVVIAARREKEGEETARLVKEAGSDGVFVKTDVTSEEDIKALVDKTAQVYGRLDYALNNAGFDEAQTTLVEETSSDFDKIVDINVRGVWLCMKYEIPQMLKNGAGSIVNMASGAGLIGIPQTPIYSASKHAVLGLTKSAAIGYAKSGIRINAVAPGLVKTPMISEIKGEFMEKLKSMHPIGRIAEPDEIAEAVVWLLSDKASFVVGHTLSVDGGIVSR